MLILAGTAAALELVTSVAGSVDVTTTWADVSAADMVPGDSHANIATATTTTVASGIVGASRLIKSFSAVNKGTAAQTVTLQKDVSAVQYLIAPTVTIQPGDALCYADGQGFYVLDNAGRRKTSAPHDVGATGQPIFVYKVGTAAEAAGSFYSWAKDPGAPGAWSPGTPGLAGRATDGMAAPDAGCLPLWTPTGALYLTKSALANTVAALDLVYDVMLVNSGIVVTTITAQTLNTVALPARDQNGAANGRGVYAGLLVTAATTNAGAIANCTISYTNQDGVAGRTGTMSSFPITAVIGTVVLFNLAAGDSGIRSVQSITLGTSLVTGAVSLILFRAVSAQTALLANVGGPVLDREEGPGVRLYNGSCLLPVSLASAATAASLVGVITVIEK